MAEKFKILGGVIIVLIVAGCATKSSGVLQLGPDTYSVIVEVNHSTAPLDARKAALSEAKVFCVGVGKELLVTNTRRPSSDVEVVFRCLNKGDPELVRPVYRDAPDTVIEDRRSKEGR